MSTTRHLNRSNAARLFHLIALGGTIEVVVTDAHRVQALKELATQRTLLVHAQAELARLQAERNHLLCLGHSTREVAGKIKTAKGSVAIWLEGEKRAEDFAVSLGCREGVHA